MRGTRQCRWSGTRTHIGPILTDRPLDQRIAPCASSFNICIGASALRPRGTWCMGGAQKTRSTIVSRMRSGVPSNTRSSEQLLLNVVDAMTGRADERRHVQRTTTRAKQEDSATIVAERACLFSEQNVRIAQR